MKVSFEGIGEQLLSFNAADGTEKGQLVKVSANNTVSPCGAGDRFAGVCVKANGDFADVMTSGYVELPYTGAAPATGFASLSAADSGRVKSDAAGREYLVISVDTAASVVGFIM